MKTDIGSTPIVEGEQTFATAPMGSSAPDSITIGGGSIWVEYGNGANSMGTPPGSSTIVQYSMKGQVENTYTSMGLADGLKYDPGDGECVGAEQQRRQLHAAIHQPGDCADQRPAAIRFGLCVWLDLQPRL
jgi:hypothetical protein